MLHKPVLLEEAVKYLKVERGRIFIDGTLGDGGHTERILEMSGPDGIVVAFDHDKEAIERTKNRLLRYKDRVRYIHKNFSLLKPALAEHGIDYVDGILLDLGVSATQLLDPDRGFSFMNSGPLDMRMDRESSLTAYKVVNNLSEAELTSIIFKYGEERWAKRIAKNIVCARKKEEIGDTLRLADIVLESIPKRFHSRRIHPATKTFQAIRIEVNQELDMLKSGLNSGLTVLRKGGRFCVITFHSLEDRITKRFFREKSFDCICNHDLPLCVCSARKEVSIITKRPVVPSKTEIESNPKARSAKLRVAQKV